MVVFTTARVTPVVANQRPVKRSKSNKRHRFAVGAPGRERHWNRLCPTGVAACITRRPASSPCAGMLLLFLMTKIHLAASLSFPRRLLSLSLWLLLQGTHSFLLLWRMANVIIGFVDSAARDRFHSFVRWEENRHSGNQSQRNFKVTISVDLCSLGLFFLPKIIPLLNRPTVAVAITFRWFVFICAWTYVERIKSSLRRISWGVSQRRNRPKLLQGGKKIDRNLRAQTWSTHVQNEWQKLCQCWLLSASRLVNDQDMAAGGNLNHTL